MPIAWKKVSATFCSVRISPTSRYSGRCRSDACNRLYIETSPRPSPLADERVTDWIQFS